MLSEIEKKVREFWEKEGLTDQDLEYKTYRSMLVIEMLSTEESNYHEDWPDTSIEWDRTKEHAEKSLHWPMLFGKS